jgi:hypothetical protein
MAEPSARFCGRHAVEDVDERVDDLVDGEVEAPSAQARATSARAPAKAWARRRCAGSSAPGAVVNGGGNVIVHTK